VPVGGRRRAVWGLRGAGRPDDGTHFAPRVPSLYIGGGAARGGRGLCINDRAGRRGGGGPSAAPRGPGEGGRRASPPGTHRPTRTGPENRRCYGRSPWRSSSAGSRSAIDRAHDIRFLRALLTIAFFRARPARRHPAHAAASPPRAASPGRERRPPMNGPEDRGG
jgi:hypothetical protein